MSVVENHSQILIGLKKPSLYHVDSFLGSKCSLDLLMWKMFPNTKEITESMGAYRAVTKTLGRGSQGEPNQCIVVGDGSTPRTGALIACMTKWDVTSIDPNLKDKTWPVNRLKCIKDSVENVEWLFEPMPERPVIVAVHSHASLEFINKMQTKPKLVVAIPCCKEQFIPGWQPSFSFADWGIFSPKRTVIVWKDEHAVTE